MTNRLRATPALRRSIVAIALCTAALALVGQTITLRMAAYVPTNSPWDAGLKELAAEYARVSGGQVRIVFPQSVRISDEKDIIQKMRLGVDGALLTTFGIAEIYPDSVALAMPSVVRNEAELDAVLETLEPLIRQKLSERYHVVVVAKGGWVRFFSKRPIVYPEDFEGMRISVNQNNDQVQRLLQSAGARPVKGDMAALLLQLNSNAVDAFYLSPVFVASLWSQYRGKIAYMSPFRVSPFIGAVVFNKASWDRIPAAIRPKLEEATRAIAKRMSAESQRIEDEALASLSRDGLAYWADPPDAETRWNAIYTDRRKTLIASMFSADVLETIDAALAKARSGK